MESERRKLSGREKDEAAVKLLEKLQDQLHSPDASNRRRAAFNLSWMQEDGLEILKKALLGSVSVTTKNAAAYGLRKMRGRMKKLALEVLKDGLKRPDNSTRDVSRHALRLLGEMAPMPSNSRKPAPKGLRIKEIARKRRPRGPISTRRSRG
jgi:HEAT repeat protein